MNTEQSMRCFLIVCLISIGHICGVITSVVATARPSWSSSFGSNTGDYQRNQDVPIIGDYFRRNRKETQWRKHKKDEKHRRQRNRRQREEVHTHDDSDSDDSDNDEPPNLFYFDSEDEGQWSDYDEYDKRQRGRRKSQDKNWKSNKLAGAVSKFPIDNFRRWTFHKFGVQIPRVHLTFNPASIIKVRKSFHNVVPQGIVRLGADVDTRRGGVWFRGCVEDKLIGGTLSIKQKRSKESGLAVEYSKSWLFAGVGSLATRFNLCASFDLKSHRGSARFGFRTENMDSIGSYGFTHGTNGGNGRQRLTIVPIIPLDGNGGRLKIEAKTNIDLPRPEFVIGMDLDGLSLDGGSLGMGIGGDIGVEVEELNVICLL